MLNYGKNILRLFTIHSPVKVRSFVAFNIAIEMNLSVINFSCGMYCIKINIYRIFHSSTFSKRLIRITRLLLREINYKDIVKYNKTIAIRRTIYYCYCFILNFVN